MGLLVVLVFFLFSDVVLIVVFLVYIIYMGLKNIG